MTETVVPTDRALAEFEVQGLICERILKLGEHGGLIQAPELIDVGNLAERCGITGQPLDTFRGLNEPVWTRRKLSQFVNRLIARGILSRAWEQSHADVFYFVSDYGLEALEDIASLIDFRSTEFVETLRDAELRARCGDILNRTRKFDSMVRDAIAVLEDRLKSMPGVQLSNRRRDIAVKALSPTTGVYTLGSDQGQQESAQLLYQGILGFFGNPVLHGLQDIDPVTARQIVGFIDTLLDLLKLATTQVTVPTSSP